METQNKEGAPHEEAPALAAAATESAGHQGGGGLTEEQRRAERGSAARRLRMERMMSKAELARRAGVSTLTVDRVERGLSCRMDTKRKIIEALGLKPSDRAMIFIEDE